MSAATTSENQRDSPQPPAPSPAPSLEGLLRELAPDLLRYFLSRVDDREDAADAVADTLLVLWRKQRSIPQEREDARRFAFGVARNVLHSWRRGIRRRTALADRLRSVVREEPTPEANLDLDLRDALSALTPKDRELVMLVAWDGFTVADAGRIVGISADAARARYSRARAKLREALASN